MRISDWSSDVCSSDLQRQTYALRYCPEPCPERALRGRIFCRVNEENHLAAGSFPPECNPAHRIGRDRRSKCFSQACGGGARQVPETSVPFRYVSRNDSESLSEPIHYPLTTSLPSIVGETQKETKTTNTARRN